MSLSSQLSPDEERAILAQLGRKPESFRVLYRHYFPRVYAYVAYRVSSRQDAEDLTSDIFLKVVASINGFEHRGGGSFAAWVFRIAHNTVQQFYRADARQDAALDDINDYHSTEHLPDEAFSLKERFGALQRHIRMLTPRRQEIVTLRFYGGLRNQDIAAVLNLDERTVASHLCRALEDLRRMYEEQEVRDE